MGKKKKKLTKNDHSEWVRLYDALADECKHYLIGKGKPKDLKILQITPGEYDDEHDKVISCEYYYKNTYLGYGETREYEDIEIDDVLEG